MTQTAYSGSCNRQGGLNLCGPFIAVLGVLHIPYSIVIAASDRPSC
jgi:hypothetical protein